MSPSLSWFCPVCEMLVSLARAESGQCVQRPRDPLCPLRPPGRTADAASKPQAPPLKRAA